MLEFIVNWKWRIVVIGGTVLIGAWAQSQLRAQRPTDATNRPVADANTKECLDSQGGLFVIPFTGDPVIDEASHQAMRDTLASRRARRFEGARQEHLLKREVRQGTFAELSPHPLVTDAQRESAAPFIELFESDPPPPQVRRNHFAEFLQPDSPDRCVAWRVYLKSAEEVEDGWLVDVEVGVHLLGLTSRFIVSDGSTNEIWHVSREGKLTFVEGSPGGAAPVYVRL